MGARVTDIEPEFAICRVESGDDDPEALKYITLKYGYSTHASAVAALKNVAAETSTPIDELAVISVVLARDLEAV